MYILFEVVVRLFTQFFWKAVPNFCASDEKEIFINICAKAVYVKMSRRRRSCIVIMDVLG